MTGKYKTEVLICSKTYEQNDQGQQCMTLVWQILLNKNIIEYHYYSPKKFYDKKRTILYIVYIIILYERLTLIHHDQNYNKYVFTNEALIAFSNIIVS